MTLRFEMMLENILMAMMSRYTTFILIVACSFVGQLIFVKVTLAILVILFAMNLALYIFWSLTTLASVVNNDAGKQFKTLAFTEMNDTVLNMFLYTFMIGLIVLVRF